MELDEGILLVVLLIPLVLADFPGMGVLGGMGPALGLGVGIPVEVFDKDRAEDGADEGGARAWDCLGRVDWGAFLCAGVCVEVSPKEVSGFCLRFCGNLCSENSWYTVDCVDEKDDVGDRLPSCSFLNVEYVRLDCGFFFFLLLVLVHL